MSFKVIYTNGDSFAAGDELGTERYFPKFSQVYSRRYWPSGLVAGQRYREELWKEWESLTKDDADPTVLLYQEECRRRSYSGVLAKKLNLPVINQARGGRSNQESVITAITYLETELLKEYQPGEILVLMGLTEFTRFCIPINYRPQGSISISIGIDEDTDTAQVRAHFSKHASDLYMANEQIAYLTAFSSYCSQLGITVIVVDSGMYRNALKHSAPWQRNLLPSPNVIMQELIESDTELCKHVFGHYSKTIHDRTADQIINILGYK